MAPTIEREPVTELRRWDVYELAGGEWHLVGNIADGRVRVSSAAIWFDLYSMSGSTASGRVYRLAGERGLSEEALRLWMDWCARYRVADWISVAAEVWALRVQSAARIVVN